MYELLTGKPPFFRGNILFQVLRAKSRPPCSRAPPRSSTSPARHRSPPRGSAPSPHAPLPRNRPAGCPAQAPVPRPTPQRADGPLRRRAIFATRSRGTGQSGSPALRRASLPCRPHPHRHRDRFWAGHRDRHDRQTRLFSHGSPAPLPSPPVASSAGVYLSGQKQRAQGCNSKSTAPDSSVVVRSRPHRSQRRCFPRRPRLLPSPSFLFRGQHSRDQGAALGKLPRHALRARPHCPAVPPTSRLPLFFHLGDTDQGLRGVCKGERGATGKSGTRCRNPDPAPPCISVGTTPRLSAPRLTEREERPGNCPATPAGSQSPAERPSRMELRGRHRQSREDAKALPKDKDAKLAGVYPWGGRSTAATEPGR